MQRHGFAWFHLFPRPACAALAAAMLGTVAACTGTIGPERGAGATGGPATGAGAGTTGAGSASGGAGASGTTGAGNATMTGTGAGTGGVAGTGAGTAGTGGTGGAPVVFAPSPGAYRRLTASAFRNSLRDLLQGPVTIGGIEPDSWSVGGLASVGAATVSISAPGVEQYQTAIDAATSQAFADATRRSKLLGCTPRSTTDTACFQSFVTKFGRLAWRQPLTSAQVTRYANLIANVATTLDDVSPSKPEVS